MKKKAPPRKKTAPKKASPAKKKAAKKKPAPAKKAAPKKKAAPPKPVAKKKAMVPPAATRGFAPPVNPDCDCRQSASGEWFRYIRMTGKKRRVPPGYATEEECLENCG